MCLLGCQTSFNLTSCCIKHTVSKITHRRWRDHTLSQGKKTTKRAVGVEVGGDGEGEGEGGWIKFEKKEGGLLGGGGLNKIGD